MLTSTDAIARGEEMRQTRASSVLSACVLSIATAALAASPAAASSSHHKAPLLKALTFTPTSTDGPDGFLQAKWTATVVLYQSAPSIYFAIDSTSSHNVETEAGPERSYTPGVHKVTFTSDALPGDTYKVTLFARVRPPKDSDSLRPPAPLKSSDPATLVVATAGEGTAGAGTVTKL
jgi:hypothetical protein